MRQLKIAIASLMMIQAAYGQTPRTPQPQTTKLPPIVTQKTQDAAKAYSSATSALEIMSTDKRKAQVEAQKRLQSQQHAILQRLIEGPGSTGGGNINAMAVLAMIKSLKDVLLAKGLDNFPEIAAKWDAFIEKINSRILIEEKHPIIINGDHKAAEFEVATNTIRFSVPELKNEMAKPNPLLRIQALLLHEVLGLLGMEGNNDYNISYRLLGLAMLEELGARGSKNQIFAKDPRDAQVIYWTFDDQNRITYVYCKNRDRTNTCQRLGNRSYTKQEVANAYAQMAVYYEKNRSLQGKILYVVIVAYAAAFIIGALIGSGPLLLPALLLTNSIAAGVSIYHSQLSENVKKFVTEVETSRQASSLMTGPTEMNLEDMAKGIHQFLSMVDKTSTPVRKP